MSPEQARGLPVDKRTDIWAFGCLLFEMLTGRRAFDGETVSETIVAVLEREPDWAALPKATPHAVRRLLRRCLEKDPHRRLHDIADARIEIDDALQLREETRDAPSPRVRNQFVKLTFLVALAAGGVALGWWLRKAVVNDPYSPRLTRSAWPLPGARTGFASDRFSGRTALAFAASAAGTTVGCSCDRSASSRRGRSRAPKGRRTRSGRPTDARWLFRARKADEGGDRRRRTGGICAARGGRGGAWSSNGVIVFSPDLIDSGLSRVRPRVAPWNRRRCSIPRRGDSHRWPVFLPDGIHFLYFVGSIRAERLAYTRTRRSRRGTARRTFVPFGV